jgi:hypothetical protein
VVASRKVSVSAASEPRKRRYTCTSIRHTELT